MDPVVTIIIPTLADTARGTVLLRALRSVAALDVPAIALVIVNGDRQDDSVLKRVSDAGAVLRRIDATGVSEARRAGRQLVKTDYFGFLDDDDVLLPNAGSVRCALFADRTVDVVVTNGYTVTDGVSKQFSTVPTETEEPALAVLQMNWLASSAAFFRTKSVPVSDFEDLPNVMELTALGFRLALRRNIKFSPEVTYVIHQDAPNRATNSAAYVERAPQVLSMLKGETDRKDLRRRLDEKILAAHHFAAGYYLQRGEIGPAWRHHLSSLKGRGFWTYVSSTRHLLWNASRTTGGSEV